MNIPAELKYAKTHEWTRLEKDGLVTVGITHHAQELLGDMVFVETPELGRKLSASEECAVVESVKAASDVYAPVAGEVVAVNAELGSTPQMINEDPYGAWLFRLKPANPAELEGLLSAAQYGEQVAGEEH